MAIEWLEGFDHYTSVAMFQRKWDSTLSDVSPGQTGRFAGFSVRLGSPTAFAGILTLGNQQTRTVGFAFWYATTTAGTNPILAFLDVSSRQVDLQLNQATGVLTVTRNGTVLGTSAAVLSISTWFYIEFQATIHSSTGSITVRVNGTDVITVSGANTQTSANAYANRIYIEGINSTSLYDDMYIENTATFHGECRVLTVLPNADSSPLQWTPSTGTAHWSLVDEGNPNDDTDYVSSSTPGHVDLYGFPDITPTGSILAVQTVLTARKDDAGVRQIADQCVSGATTATGATATITSSYLMYRQIRETDPDTGAAWTAAGFNAASFGQKVIS